MAKQPVDTEDYFIDQIEDASGEEFEGADDGEGEVSRQKEPITPAVDDQDAAPTRRDRQPADQKLGNDNKPNAKPGGQRTEGRQDHIPGLRDDGKGNLVNAKGEIVLRGGPERRALQDFVANTRGRLNNSVKRVADLEKENTRLKGIVEGTSSQGLTPDQLRDGIAFIRGWSQNPASVIKTLLTFAKQKGIQIDGIANGAIDQDALVGRIKQEFAPVLNQASMTQQQSDQRNQATAAIEGFLGDNQDARPHMEHILYLMQTDPTTGRPRSGSLGEAYWKLKAFAQTNGLDWGQPLEPQMQAKANNQNGANGTNPAPRTPPAGGRNQANLTPVGGRSKAASDSWQSIIGEAISESRVQ